MVEPLAACNLQCPLYPTGNGSTSLSCAPLAPDDFRRLLAMFSGSLRRLYLFRWGEPFLYPRLLDMVALAERAGVAVTVHANLNRFTPEQARATVAAGLSRLSVSIDGTSQETYSRYRRGGRLTTVLRHIRWILREKRRQGGDRPAPLDCNRSRLQCPDAAG